MLLVLASHALELTLNQCISLDFYYYVSLSDTVLNQLHKCLLQRIEVVLDASNLCTPSPTELALLRRRACC